MLRNLGLFIVLPILVIVLISQLGVFDSGSDEGGFSDRDNNGFSDALEEHAGTDPLDDCADNVSDRTWPPDFNNDGSVTDFDLDAIVSPPTLTRGDIAPDPPDGNVDITDLGRVAGFLGEGC